MISIPLIIGLICSLFVIFIEIGFSWKKIVAIEMTENGIYSIEKIRPFLYRITFSEFLKRESAIICEFKSFKEAKIYLKFMV